MRLTIAIALVVSVAMVAFAEAVSPTDNPSCRTRREVVAPCFDLHGRLDVANGSPGVRIWQVGTKRILGVLPDEAWESLPKIVWDHIGVGVRIYGDFSFCPFEQEKKGRMRMGCVAAAHDLVEEDCPDAEHPCKMRRLPSGSIEEAVFGEWQVSGHLAPGVSAMSAERSDAWRGRKAAYSAARASFNNHTCSKPTYRYSEISAAEFETQFRASPQDLGIPDGESVRIVAVECDGLWVAPGATLVLGGPRRVLTLWDGVFFELRRE